MASSPDKKVKPGGKGGKTSIFGSNTNKSYGRSYGSTRTSIATQETYIKHTVSPGDTLQGIALKYGTTVQHIKRVNKLYTNDSIFLRPTLNVPVGDVPLPAHVLQTATADTNGSHACSKSHEGTDDEKEDDASNETKENVIKDNPMDFLNRIDQQLQQHTSSFKKIEETSSIGQIHDLPGITISHKSPNISSRISATPGLNDSYQLAGVTVNTPETISDVPYESKSTSLV
ncbi:lysM and putative peptidoglycan-binding domain-containing protein 2-like [Anneissia japonica]|uniref:lysM and putative peptidoglycan-binding domain-containing protein 2-like n=1 Tax=Anneissia japonica TaxID=1529436 RepID=UPI00142570C8|nr:lysM and putative peptidoglycan-binding domain-containing protein 2-like [Anneissia japonica]